MDLHLSDSSDTSDLEENMPEINLHLVQPYQHQPIAVNHTSSENEEEEDFIPDLAHFFGTLCRLNDNSW